MHAPMSHNSAPTLLTLQQLSERVGLKPETIMRTKVDTILLAGKHYVRPLGGRKLMFIWESIFEDMMKGYGADAVIPMANGGTLRG